MGIVLLFPRSTNFVLICNYVIIYFYYYFECEVKESNEYENSLYTL